MTHSLLSKYDESYSDLDMYDYDDDKISFKSSENLDDFDDMDYEVSENEVDEYSEELDFLISYNSQHSRW
jgi:hypothetical protein